MSRKRKNGNGDHRQNRIENFSAKTEHQRDYIRSIYENIVTICYGCAGTGKSMCSIGIACQKLLQNDIENIVVCKPLIGCDNEIGTLPGTVNERIHPYMYPILEYFEYFLGKSQVQMLLNQSIHLFPIELVRGHTYNDSFMILEESQNCTPKQIKMFLSRMGHNSTVVIIGDNTQTDIQDNGLQFCIDCFNCTSNLNVIKFDMSDVQRHEVIPEILTVFENNGV